MDDLRPKIMKMIRPSALILGAGLPHEINVHQIHFCSSLLALSTMIERTVVVPNYLTPIYCLLQEFVIRSIEYNKNSILNRRPFN